MPETTITAEPGSSLITITREFDAPRELVFRAHVDPDLLVQWLGPRELTMTVDRYEAHDGGTYHYIHRNSQGDEYGFRGVFHGDPTPDGLVQTFEFDGAPGHVSLNLIPFTQHGDRTELRTVAGYTMLGSDMERGVRDGHDRLEELLAKAQL
jgi:uncharacterized protein YndB with AHSA1/START domain